MVSVRVSPSNGTRTREAFPAQWNQMAWISPVATTSTNRPSHSKLVCWATLSKTLGGGDVIEGWWMGVTAAHQLGSNHTHRSILDTTWLVRLDRPQFAQLSAGV
ncbi:uncharacterized protein BO97DRAFT_273850 [Aspergillus homomorphus CBS 101889]|uniref:Uncharacterized protein n=1 Tax=Aspergillus homomorphus (strain CBS 101889) TaxID=1450537 RepID=A0A395I5Z8_ASPHC|nr:hypothetical protein BO97DRAFT_273850 [Aspergillus homomorphus CBS 101889]RAL14608.1 hypothetical protein BO97DRAFT_273850 [Aspergillus homomorphus CBS 101889]